MIRVKLLRGILLGAVLLACGALGADELQEISKLANQGQLAPALERITAYLAKKPKDAQARFLKGLILTKQNKLGEAADTFSGLVDDYPELPEPYNNLAVVYAAQGQYERARGALEQAIHAQPNYSTAYENLGDIYAKLASRAYEKAQQIDAKNTTAKTKLALINELFGGKPR